MSDKVTSGWPSVRLDHVAELCLGKMLDKEKNKGEPRPYLANINVRWGSFELQDLREMRFEEREFERYGLRFGDIVMCEGGEPGRCAIWTDEVPGMMIQKALHRIRPREGVDSHYLCYALTHGVQSGSFDEYMTGSGIRHLPGNQVAKLEVLMPSLHEQRRIAEALRSVDDAIAAQRATVEQHTRLIDAIFEEWSNQPAPMIALGDLLDFKNGINFEKDQKGEEGTLTLDVMNMFSADMTPTYEGAYRISKAVPSELLLERGDILFVRSSVKQQGVGWASLADGFGERTTFCGFIIRGRPKCANVLSPYIVGVLRAPRYRRWLIQHSTRSALTNINQKTIASVEIPLPNLENQKALVEKYKQFATAVSDSSTAMAKLERLRSDVTNDLLSGRVRVPA